MSPEILTENEKPKHTVGEWRLTERKIGVESLIPADVQGIKSHSRHPIAVTDPKNPNREGDALLISAAPRMYAALKQLLVGSEREHLLDGFHNDWLDAFDAIDKAEGRPIQVRPNQPHRETGLSLVPQPNEIDWPNRTYYCGNCGRPRSINRYLTAETCPNCGDDETDLAEEVGP